MVVVSTMTDTVAPTDVPRALMASIRTGGFAVLVTACRAGSDEVVTVEMTLKQWLELPA
jgi:hypothetical protein